MKVSEESVKFYSYTKWSNSSIGISKDEHDTYEEANAVRMRLLHEYGKGRAVCDIRGNCLQAWVRRVPSKTKGDDK